MFIHRNIYLDRAGKISDLFNRLQHGVLGHAHTIILTIFVCKYLSAVG
jgi:hypothetical protein